MTSNYRVIRLHLSASSRLFRSNETKRLNQLLLVVDEAGEEGEGGEGGHGDGDHGGQIAGRMLQRKPQHEDGHTCTPSKVKTIDTEGLPSRGL